MEGRGFTTVFLPAALALLLPGGLLAQDTPAAHGQSVDTREEAVNNYPATIDFFTASDSGDGDYDDDTGEALALSDGLTWLFPSP